MLEKTRNSAQSQTQEQHILVIDDHECGVFALDAATYSIGRDSNNAIVLNDPSVSRKHALLLRMPIPGENRYRYRLIDGNSNGESSSNGTIVNGESCQSHDLAKGDSIQFGKNSFCTYLMISGEEAEMSNYLASAEFQSIKSGPIDSKATISANILESSDNADMWLADPLPAEQEDGTIIFSKRGAARKAAAAQSEGDVASKPQRSQRHHWKIILGAVLSAILLAAGLWHHVSTSSPDTTAPESVTAPKPN